MWTTLRPVVLESNITAKRLTDRASGGVPDVVYVDALTRVTGFCELKFLDAWPQTSRKGLLTYADLRGDQALWLAEWARGGGVAGILLRVAIGHVDRHEWLYWRARPDVAWAKEILSWRTQEAIVRADYAWRGRPTDVEIRTAWLTACGAWTDPS